jgi:hypothetical protein
VLGLAEVPQPKRDEDESHHEERPQVRQKLTRGRAVDQRPSDRVQDVRRWRDARNQASSRAGCSSGSRRRWSVSGGTRWRRCLLTSGQPVGPPMPLARQRNPWHRLTVSPREARQ